MRFARPRHVLRPTGLVEALATNDSTPAHLGCCARQGPATGGSFAVRAQSDASHLISGAVGMAHWRFAGLCARIDAAGKRVGDMTVDELLRVIREHKAHMERIEAEGEANG
jgi:hypothetical protein